MMTMFDGYKPQEKKIPECGPAFAIEVYPGTGTFVSMNGVDVTAGLKSIYFSQNGSESPAVTIEWDPSVADPDLKNRFLNLAAGDESGSK